MPIHCIIDILKEKIEKSMYGKRHIGVVCAIVALFFVSFIKAQDNIAPTVTATGDQFYCPGTVIPIVTDFDIVDPDDTDIDFFSVQITIGYQRGQDILRLQNDHSGLTTEWDPQEGKLNFSGIGGLPILYVDLIPAIRDVVFESSSDNPVEEKFFSLTAGSANFLPSTGHYYEYIPSIGIRWDQARTAAENRTFFGLQGYLATITSAEEAQLSGEQAAGAGWIGGSDSQQEGVWRWMTGPEAGDVFWNGGFNGTTPTFAFWNTGEPNSAGDEDYAHVTAPNVGIPGSWNDLSITGAPSGDFQPKGYVVEYGGTPGDPVINLSASTKLTTPKIVETFSDEICGTGRAMLSAVPTIGESVWFASETGGAPIATGDFFETSVLDTDTVFYVIASVDGCLSGRRRPVDVVVRTPPTINENLVFTNCDEDGMVDGFTDFNFTQFLSLITPDFSNFEITFHLSEEDAENTANSQSATAFNNSLANEVFFRVQGTGDFCHSLGSISLDVSTTSFPSDFLFELETCDTNEPDGITLFSLEEAVTVMLSQFPTGQDLSVSFFNTNEDAILKQNEIEDISSYQNTIAFSETLFVRVDDDDSGTCFGIGEHLLLTVLPLPVFSLESEYFVCSNETVDILPLNPQGNYQYTWFNADDEVISNDSILNIGIEGNYSVVATNIEDCSSEPIFFTVIASSAPILQQEFIEIDNTTITILNSNGELGLGNYEFSLDNPFGPFQTNGVFLDVSPGIHTIFALDINGCGTDSIEVGIVSFPNFFTPNNDGTNDVLLVMGVSQNFYQSGTATIYDRYGKLLVQIDVMEGSWDGSFNGSALPSSDYWYLLELVTIEGELQTENGHFTLKR